MKAKRLLCILLCVFIISAYGCGTVETNPPEDVAEPVAETAPEPEIPPEPVVTPDDLSTLTAPEPVLPEYAGADTLKIRIGDETAVFNPFYASGDLAALTAAPLVTLDRSGLAITGGRDGETVSFRGTEYTYCGIAKITHKDNTYTFTLDENVFDSNGVNLTADDVLFSLYVYADPAYSGVYDIKSLPIEGLSEYGNGYKLGLQAALDTFAEQGEQAPEYKSFAEAFNTLGLTLTKDLIAHSVENYLTDYGSLSQLAVRADSAEIIENPGLQTAFAEYVWDYATGFNDKDVWEDGLGTYDLIESFPTEESFWNLIKQRCAYDTAAIGQLLCGSDTAFSEQLADVLRATQPELLDAVPTEGVQSASSISGIVKTGMYQIEITTDGSETPEEFLTSLSVPVVPLESCLGRENYKYTENRFGFVKGQLEFTHSLTPTGFGAYTAVNDTTLTRNVNYYQGAPCVSKIVLTDAADADIVFGDTEAADGEEEPPEDEQKPDDEEAKESDAVTVKEFSVSTGAVSFLGIDAKLVNVSGRKDSKQSAYLRRAVSSLLTGDTETARDAFAELGYEFDGESGEVTKIPQTIPTELGVYIAKTNGMLETVNASAEEFAKYGIGLTVNVMPSDDAFEKYPENNMADIWFSERDLDNVSQVVALIALFDSTKDVEKALKTADAAQIAAVTSECLNELSENCLCIGLSDCSVTYSLGERALTLPENMTVFYSWTHEIQNLKIG